MKINTCNLTGCALDWAVAKAMGKEPYIEVHAGNVWYGSVTGGFVQYHPSENWAIAGPIIESNQINIKWVTSNLCRAAYEWVDEEFHEGFGSTPLEAGMRCYVSMHLGDVVDIPEAYHAKP